MEYEVAGGELGVEGKVPPAADVASEPVAAVVLEMAPIQRSVVSLEGEGFEECAERVALSRFGRFEGSARLKRNLHFQI